MPIKATTKEMSMFPGWIRLSYSVLSLIYYGSVNTPIFQERENVIIVPP